MHDRNGNTFSRGMVFEGAMGMTTECDRHQLLSKGWKVYARDFDYFYFQKVIEKEPLTFFQKAVGLIGSISENLTRSNFSLLSNILTVYQNTQPEFQSFWDFITPVPPSPNYRHWETFGAEFPRSTFYSRNTIFLEEAYLQLQEVLLCRILEFLGIPTLIRQYPCFSFPIENFIDFDKLDILERTQIFWENHDIWLDISPGSGNQKQYVLSGADLSSWIDKASYNLAIIKSGTKATIGEIKSGYSLSSYPEDVQLFTNDVMESIFEDKHTVVLLYGEPGTGKTVWTQSLAKEYLVQLGYTIFILDKDSILDFSPPGYLKKVALIINECDNLAQNRKSNVAQHSSRTEHVLSLLDGTLYNSVVNKECSYSQNLVVLMTCNTIERLDPAMLRKGRVDFIKEFTHKFI